MALALPDKKSNIYNRYISEFIGLNRLPINSEGELFSSENMVFDPTPAMSIRGGRTLLTSLEGTPQGIISASGVLAWVLSGTLYYNGVATGLTTLTTIGVKSMVEFWGKIFIFPDAKYYNTADGTYGDVGTGTFPATGSCPAMDYICVHNNRIWGVKENYIYASSNGYAMGKPSTITCEYTADGTETAGDYYINDGMDDWVFTLSSALSESDELVLDGVTGVVTVNDTQVTTAVMGIVTSETQIEAELTYSTLGWTQWYDANGDADDNGSFYQQVASDGDFMGIASWDNRIVALKERCHHEIQGSYPSAFELSTISKFGTFNHLSIQEVNSKLYYVTSTGVLLYGGGLESDYSRKLNEEYVDAVAGTDGLRYYLCLNNGDTSKKLYVYNSLTDMWTEEDSLDVVDFCQHSGKMYAMCADGNIYAFNDPDSTETVEWSFEFSDYSEDIFTDTKVSKIIVKASGEDGANMSIKLAVDDGEFETIKTVDFPANTLHSATIKAKRGQVHTFRIEGSGKITFYGIWYRCDSGGENIV